MSEFKEFIGKASDDDEVQKALKDAFIQACVMTANDQGYSVTTEDVAEYLDTTDLRDIDGGLIFNRGVWGA